MTESNENEVVEVLTEGMEDVSPPTGKSNRISKSLPDVDDPIICKLVPAPGARNGPLNTLARTGYVKMNWWTHKYGPKEDNIGYHPDIEYLGITDKASPESVLSNELWNTKRDLEKKKKKESNEYRKNEARMNNLKKKDGGYIYYVIPNCPQIFALKIGKQVTNKLWGKKESQYSKPVASLLAKMKKDNMSAWINTDDKINSTGWLRLYKTGKGLSTEHHVVVDSRPEIVNAAGKDLEIDVPRDHVMHDKFTSGKITLSDFPDVIAYESAQAMTYEESKAFVDSEMTVVPDRFLRNDNKKFDETDEADPNVVPDIPGMDLNESSGNEEVMSVPKREPATPSLDEIPF